MGQQQGKKQGKVKDDDFYIDDQLALVDDQHVDAEDQGVKNKGKGGKCMSCCKGGKGCIDYREEIGIYDGDVDYKLSPYVWSREGWGEADVGGMS